VCVCVFVCVCVCVCVQTGSSASGAWSIIMKRRNSALAARGLAESKTAVSGPEYFGLANPEVSSATCIIPIYNADV
jgi:hypothetical protein